MTENLKATIFCTSVGRVNPHGGGKCLAFALQMMVVEMVVQAREFSSIKINDTRYHDNNYCICACIPGM